MGVGEWRTDRDGQMAMDSGGGGCWSSVFGDLDPRGVEQRAA
jgi:hypothetical protein